MFTLRWRSMALCLSALFCLTLFCSTTVLAASPSQDVVHVSGEIADDTAWTSDKLYIVDADLTVNQGILLSIEGGTVIKFAQYADLIVKGALQVNDPPELWTVFVPLVIDRSDGAAASASPQRSHPQTTAGLTANPLRTVYFTSVHDDSVGGVADSAAQAPQMGDWGGIIFEDISQDERSHMRGFEVRYSGQSSDSRLVGAIVLKKASPHLSQGAFGDNYINGIEIPSAFASSWPEDTWDARGIVYYVNGGLTVARGNTLRIQGGVIVKFAQAMRLTVKGALQAQGSPANPVILTSHKDDAAGGDTNADGSTAPAAEDWGGVLFDDDSRGNANALVGVEIRYSGKSGSSRVAAIELDQCSPTLSQIKFVDNHLNGAQLGGGFTYQLDSLALASTDVPYLVMGDLTVKQYEKLTIGPGVKLKFSTGKRLTVEGVLDARGVPGNRIVMTSLKDDEVLGDTNNDGQQSVPQKGDWRNVTFAAMSDDAQSVIEWVRMRYGGGSSFGVIRLENASPVLSQVSMADNTINGAQIPGGDWETDTWDSQSVVYYLTRPLRIPVGQTLTIQPGVVVKVLDSTPAPITVEGALQAGDMAGPVAVITSGKDDAVGPPDSDNWDSNGDGASTAPKERDWLGLVFAPGSDRGASYLSNVVFRYGGQRKGTFNERHGALRVETGPLTVTGCTFALNDVAVQAVDGALPVINWSRFVGNVDYAVYNESQGTMVTATSNWWGAPDGPRPDGEGCNTATGSGGMVSCRVDFAGWLTAAP